MIISINMQNCFHIPVLFFQYQLVSVKSTDISDSKTEITDKMCRFMCLIWLKWPFNTGHRCNPITEMETEH